VIMSKPKPFTPLKKSFLHKCLALNKNWSRMVAACRIIRPPLGRIFWGPDYLPLFGLDNPPWRVSLESKGARGGPGSCLVLPPRPLSLSHHRATASPHRRLSGHPFGWISPDLALLVEESFSSMHFLQWRTVPCPILNPSCWLLGMFYLA
jgi:hypothetical protein